MPKPTLWPPQVEAERARKMGATVGDGTLLFGSLDLSSEKTAPFNTVGSGCLIASHAQFLAHGYTDMQPIHVGNDCYIGWGAIILPGVAIGDGCLIGAGSVVTCDVPSGMFAAGNPARVIGPVDPEKHAVFVAHMRQFRTTRR